MLLKFHSIHLRLATDTPIVTWCVSPNLMHSSLHLEKLLVSTMELTIIPSVNDVDAILAGTKSPCLSLALTPKKMSFTPEAAKTTLDFIAKDCLSPGQMSIGYVRISS